jgi:hypothetical protein
MAYSSPRNVTLILPNPTTFVFGEKSTIQAGAVTGGQWYFFWWNFFSQSRIQTQKLKGCSP